MCPEFSVWTVQTWIVEYDGGRGGMGCSWVVCIKSVNFVCVCVYVSGLNDTTVHDELNNTTPRTKWGPVLVLLYKSIKAFGDISINK